MATHGGGSGGGVALTVDQRDIARVVAALKSEADGKDLRRELTRDMRRAAAPVVAELKASIRSAGSQGLPHTQGGPLRQEIARAIKPSARLGGAVPNVAIKVAATPNVRNFRKAAKNLNARSWRHKVYGRSTWVTQTGKPGWFDATTAAKRDEFRTAVMDSIESMARRIAARSHR